MSTGNIIISTGPINTDPHLFYEVAVEDILAGSLVSISGGTVSRYSGLGGTRAPNLIAAQNFYGGTPLNLEDPYVSGGVVSVFEFSEGDIILIRFNSIDPITAGDLLECVGGQTGQFAKTVISVNAMFTCYESDAGGVSGRFIKAQVRA